MKNMLKKSFILTSLITSCFFFCACSNNSEVINQPAYGQKSETDTVSIHAEVFTGVEFERETARLTYGLGQGFESIEFPDNIVAGDLLTITYTGEMITLEKYPSTTYLQDGEVISYHFYEAEIRQFSLADEKTTLSKEDFPYPFYSESLVNVIILDEEKHYQKLTEASDLKEVYYSIYDDMIYGIYAYNPRVSE